MMNEKELLNWLMVNGCPTIKYRTITELMDNQLNPDSLVNDLFQVNEIASLLQRLESYEPIKIVDSHTFNSIHSGYGTEGTVAKLIELGLKAGIQPFDSRMQVFRQYVNNEFVSRALTSPYGQDVGDSRAIFTAVLLASCFVRARYEYDEIINFIKVRINLLYKIACDKQFNIHLSDIELSNYPKRPKCWDTSQVIRPEYDPGCNEKPLPLVHDIFCLSFLPKTFIDNDLDKKIGRIIEYVLDEKFQALPTGYGLVYYSNNKRYYGMGWNPKLPCFNNFDSEYEQGTLVLYMELMANFKEARESCWFKNCLRYLEQYKTNNGTYCFPRNFLKNKKNNGFVDGMSMGLGENRRSVIAYEIESTFRMLLIKKRLNML